MSRYQFELATSADDFDLRSVLLATPMSGPVAVAFKREPSFFAASVVEGTEVQVVAARDRTTGRIVGFGCRSKRKVFLNGEPTCIGYLGSLRLLAEHRHRGLVAWGFRLFHKLHAAGNTKLYLTTIAEDNVAALATLTGARAGLPRYHDRGRYITAILLTGRRRKHPRVAIGPATCESLPEVIEFWRRHGPRRQCFPFYTADDLRLDGALRGLAVSNILVARIDGAIAGTIGLWDQRSFRQSVVTDYSGSLRRLRPWYNAWAALTGRPRLPPPGTSLDLTVGALPVVANDRDDVFAALLDAALARVSQSGGVHLMVGLHESDPLLEEVIRRRPYTYVTRFFIACWDDGESELAALDGRPPYLELGSL